MTDEEISVGHLQIIWEFVALRNGDKVEKSH